MEEGPTWMGRRGRQSPLERVAEVPPRSQHPLCPETHRDQGCPPVPKLGQQLVCQVHTLLDACADLYGQGHIQHLQEWLWSARPKVRQGRWAIVGRTWFMQRTICWNLAERFMRAQPPPWERQAAGARKGRTQPGPDTPSCPCCIRGETAAQRAP